MTDPGEATGLREALERIARLGFGWNKPFSPLLARQLVDEAVAIAASALAAPSPPPADVAQAEEPCFDCGGPPHKPNCPEFTRPADAAAEGISAEDLQWLAGIVEGWRAAKAIGPIGPTRTKSLGHCERVGKWIAAARPSRP